MWAGSRTRWQRGLDGSQAISGNGRYREQAGDEVLALGTCVWRGFEFVTLGDQPRPLFGIELPASYRTTVERRSWTGKAVRYRWGNDGVTIDLRTTLPGPLLTADNRRLRLRWASGSEPQHISSLTDTCAFGSHGLPQAGGRRLWLAQGPHLPVLVVASAPISAISVVSHMHWEVTFARAGGALLIVPLLSAADIPRDAATQAHWLALAERPPLVAQERFRDADQRLIIEAHFPGARRAPVPPWFTLVESADDQRDLLRLPATIALLKTWCGPYAITVGNRWHASLAMDWSRADWQDGTMATGDLAELPEELAYAGDATWEPGSAMDQCLSLRTWAPLLAAAPPPLQAALVERLTPPTSAAFIAGVEHLRELCSRRPWARLRQMWDHTGDACYDVDWYNGLVLSGLARASTCAIAAIAEPARRLVRACRRERAALAEYFAIFHDWALGSAWSDPRGWMWNADCCHNGLEGLLAEAQMCAAEGRTQASVRWRYLAARTAIGLRASLAMPAWFAALEAGKPTSRALTFDQPRMITWSTTAGTSADDATPDIGLQACISWRQLTWCTTATRNPYVLAGHFPQWNALLAAHGPIAALRALVDAHEPDWLRAYLGTDWRQRQARGDQEARVQAAVFYHLAPLVACRRWVLQEAAQDIEASYAVALGLAEQLLLRGGFTAGVNPPEQKAAHA